MNEPHGLYEAAGRRRGEQRFLIVLGVLGLALALVLGAFFLGRVFSLEASQSERERAGEGTGQVDADSLSDAALGGQDRPGDEESESNGDKKAKQQPTGRLDGKPYRGPRAAVTPQVARAGCQSKESVDAGGRRVAYSAMNTIDNRRASAWRCDGNGKGKKVRFDFGRSRQIVAVGLIPGYAKTDPVNGVDRYRENRRIKAVRWSFGGGRFVVQRFDHRPGNRKIQRMGIPAVRTDRVTLEILGSTSAKRNTVAISKAFFAAAKKR